MNIGGQQTIRQRVAYMLRCCFPVRKQMNSWHRKRHFGRELFGTLPRRTRAARDSSKGRADVGCATYVRRVRAARYTPIPVLRPSRTRCCRWRRRTWLSGALVVLASAVWRISKSIRTTGSRLSGSGAFMRAFWRASRGEACAQRARAGRARTRARARARRIFGRERASRHTDHGWTASYELGWGGRVR
eukprot:gene2272-biopygen19971